MYFSVFSGENPAVEVKSSGFPLENEYIDKINKLSQNMTFLLKKLVREQLLVCNLFISTCLKFFQLSSLIHKEKLPYKLSDFCENWNWGQLCIIVIFQFETELLYVVCRSNLITEKQETNENTRYKQLVHYQVDVKKDEITAEPNFKKVTFLCPHWAHRRRKILTLGMSAFRNLLQQLGNLPW